MRVRQRVTGGFVCVLTERLHQTTAATGPFGPAMPLGHRSQGPEGVNSLRGRPIKRLGASAFNSARQASVLERAAWADGGGQSYLPPPSIVTRPAAP